MAAREKRGQEEYGRWERRGKEAGFSRGQEAGEMGKISQRYIQYFVIEKWNKEPGLRWLERVFKCYKPLESRKDYKEIFLTMWTIYEYLDNSFVGQYFKGGCDVIAITMTTLKVHKKNPQISVFAIYSKN